MELINNGSTNISKHKDFICISKIKKQKLKDNLDNISSKIC